MKNINIQIEDAEHTLLSKMKAHNTWRSALLYGCKKLEEEREEIQGKQEE